MTAASTKALQIAIVFFMGLLRGTSRLGPSFIILRWQIERNRSTRLSGDAIYEAGAHERRTSGTGAAPAKAGQPGVLQVAAEPSVDYYLLGDSPVTMGKSMRRLQSSHEPSYILASYPSIFAAK